MTSCHGELLQVMRRPSEQMTAQVVVEGLGLRATKMGHENQHETDVVLGGLIVSCPRDAVRAHPRAQRKRRLSEHDALAIGISSSAKAASSESFDTTRPLRTSSLSCSMAILPRT